MTDILVFQFVTLFVMIDPVGVAALFVGIAAHIAAAERRAMAVRGVAIRKRDAIALGLMARWAARTRWRVKTPP